MDKEDREILRGKGVFDYEELIVLRKKVSEMRSEISNLCGNLQSVMSIDIEAESEELKKCVAALDSIHTKLRVSVETTRQDLFLNDTKLEK